MNTINFSKIRDVKSPVRGHTNDAGIDMFVPESESIIELKPGEQAIIPSGIKMNIPKGYALIAFNKSGIATKKQLIKGAEICDSGYEGEIHINVHNVGNIIQKINPGDKLIQFLLLPISGAIPTEVKEDELFTETSERGEGKFGSTGTK